MLSKSSTTDSPNPCAKIPLGLGAVTILILLLDEGFQNVCQYFNIWNVCNPRQQERKRVIFLKMAVKRRDFPCCTACWIKNLTLKKAGKGEHSAVKPQWKLDTGFNLCNALGTCCTYLGPDRHNVWKAELSPFCWPGNKPWPAISLGWGSVCQTLRPWPQTWGTHRTHCYEKCTIITTFCTCRIKTTCFQFHCSKMLTESTTFTVTSWLWSSQMQVKAVNKRFMWHNSGTWHLIALQQGTHFWEFHSGYLECILLLAESMISVIKV